MSRWIIRLEPLLTRDYIDRAEKMRDLHPARVSASTWDVVTTWIVLAWLLAWAVLAW